MKKHFKIILLLITIIIIVIIYLKGRNRNLTHLPVITQRNDISIKQSVKENYIFVSKWGSEGSDYGEFGGDLGNKFKLTDKTIKNLKTKLSNKKLQQLKKFMSEKYGRDDLYLLKNKLNFDNREYNMVLREACIDKPKVNDCQNPQSRRNNGPDYIAVDKSNNIYIEDFYNKRFQKFNSSGKFITEWYIEGLYYWPVKVDTEGNTYLFDSEEYLHKFDSNGKFIKKLDFRYGGIKQPDGLRGLTIDEKGYFFLVDYEDYVYVFDPDGVFIKKWSIYNQEFIKMNKDDACGSSITVDEKGYVFIEIRYTICKSKDRNLIYEYFRTYLSKSDTHGYSFITEGFGPGIVKYDSSGHYITKWLERYLLDEPNGGGMGRITTDFKSNIFIANKASHCIQKFDTNGNFITKFGSKGSKDGQFLYPQAVAVDQKGNVYVMDSGNFRVQKFTLQRKPISNN